MDASWIFLTQFFNLGMPFFDLIPDPHTVSGPFAQIFLDTFLFVLQTLQLLQPSLHCLVLLARDHSAFAQHLEAHKTHNQQREQDCLSPRQYTDFIMSFSKARLQRRSINTWCDRLSINLAKTSRNMSALGYAVQVRCLARTINGRGP